MRISEFIKQSSRVGEFIRKGMNAIPHVSGSYTSRKFTLPENLHSKSKGTIGGLTTFLGSDAKHVISSSVPAYVEGMGLGRKLYGGEIRRSYLDYLKGGPRHFASDNTGATSEKATFLWQSLKRRGYPVAELPIHDRNRFTIDLEDMKRFYKDASHLPVLLQAKAHSDKSNYHSKHVLLRKLLQESPEDFVVDSYSKGIVGLTHPQTGFRIHMPVSKLPPNFSPSHINKSAEEKITSHTKTLSSGETVDVLKLWDLVKDRQSELVSMDSLKRPSRSKRTGFSKRRYAKVPPDMPVLTDSDNFIIDGRHRFFKREDNGEKSIYRIPVTERDLRMVVLPEETPRNDYQSEGKSSIENTEDSVHNSTPMEKSSFIKLSSQVVERNWMGLPVGDSLPEGEEKAMIGAEVGKGLGMTGGGIGGYLLGNKWATKDHTAAMDGLKTAARFKLMQNALIGHPAAKEAGHWFNGYLTAARKPFLKGMGKTIGSSLGLMMLGGLAGAKGGYESFKPNGDVQKQANALSIVKSTPSVLKNVTPKKLQTVMPNGFGQWGGKALDHINKHRGTYIGGVAGLGGYAAGNYSGNKAGVREAAPQFFNMGQQAGMQYGYGMAANQAQNTGIFGRLMGNFDFNPQAYGPPPPPDINQLIQAYYNK